MLNYWRDPEGSSNAFQRFVLLRGIDLLRLPSHVLGITAHGRCKQWQEALNTFDSLKRHANVYVYNATISACEKILD